MATKGELTKTDLKDLPDDADVVEMSVREARDLIDKIDHEVLCGALDEAQGRVFGGEQTISYLVIKIVS